MRLKATISLATILIACCFFSYSLVMAQDAGTPAPCNTDGFFYVEVHPVPIQSVNEQGETVTTTPKMFVLQLRSDAPVGLILPNSARIFVFSALTQSMRVEVYRVRAASSPGGYQVTHESPLMASVSELEQGIFNWGLSHRHPELGCDSNQLQATRPVNVVGSLMLNRNDNGQANVRRERLTKAGAFYNHELIVIQPLGSSVKPEPQGVVAFDFLDDEIEFQLVQLGDSVIDVQIPSLTGSSRYRLITNKPVNIEMISGRLEPDLPRSNSGVDTREVFLQWIGQTNTFLFELMRDASLEFYPHGGRQDEYNPETYMRLDMSQPAPDRDFTAGQQIRAIEGFTPRIFTPDGRIYSNLQSASIFQVAEGGADNSLPGQLRVHVVNQATPLIAEGWFMEPVAGR